MSGAIPTLSSKYGGNVKSQGLRDTPILIQTPHAKSPTPMITDAAPDRPKRQRNRTEMETSRPSSSVRRIGNGGSSPIDIFVKATGIHPDSESSNYQYTTYNFNKVTNQFQKNIFQYESSKEDAENKIRSLETRIRDLTTEFEAPRNDDEKFRLKAEGERALGQINHQQSLANFAENSIIGFRQETIDT